MPVIDSFRLDGKVAVVTGGNRGLGRAFAQALGEAGAAVAVLARDEAANERAVGELSRRRDRGPRRSWPTWRTGRPFSAPPPRSSRRSGAVDVLVNNAGTCIHRPALEVTPQEWDEVITVNLTGVWNGCQVFGRHMVDAGGGVIVNVGSMSAAIVNRPQWQPAYNASKAGVHHLTRSLAAEWAPSACGSTRWRPVTCAPT